MRFRFRYLTGPVHTKVRLFAGPSDPPTGTLGKCGDFVMRNEEWSAFIATFAEYSPLAEVEFVPEERETQL